MVSKGKLAGFTAFLVVLFVVGGSLSYGYDFGEHDLGGRTVNLVLRDQAMPYLEDYFDGPGAGLIEQAEEEFNCRIQLLPYSHGEYLETLTSRLMAGDSQYDLWFNLLWWSYEMVVDGKVYPVSEFLDPSYYDDYLVGMLRDTARSVEYQGDIYSFGSGFHPSANADRLEMLVAYNREIFEREGMPDPQDLYEAGEWTWDAMRDLAVQAQRDTTGDGEIDQFGIVDGNGFFWNTTYLAASANAPMQQRRDGRIVVTVDEEPFIKTVEYIQDLYDRDLISGWRQEFIDGEGAMFFNAPGWYQTRVAEEVEFDFGVVPHPLAPWQGKEDRYHASAANLTMLPINVERPEALIAVKHFLFPRENYNPESHFQAAVRDRRSFEILVDAYYNDTAVMRGYSGVASPDFGPVIRGEQTAAVAMAEQKPALQAALDELLDQ